jgi:hypothetical protein
MIYFLLWMSATFAEGPKPPIEINMTLKSGGVTSHFQLIGDTDKAQLLFRQNQEEKTKFIAKRNMADLGDLFHGARRFVKADCGRSPRLDVKMKLDQNEDLKSLEHFRFCLKEGDKNIVGIADIVNSLAFTAIHL